MAGSTPAMTPRVVRQLVKIPRRRQDADVARVTDFLSRIVGVFTAVVIEFGG